MPHADADYLEGLFQSAKEAIQSKDYLAALTIYNDIDPVDDDTKQRLCLNTALCLRNMSKATGDAYEQAAMTAYLFGMALHAKTNNRVRLNKLRSGLDKLAMMKALAQEVYAQDNAIMPDLQGHFKPADFEMDLQSFYNRSTNFDKRDNPYRDAVGYVLLRQLHAYMRLDKPDDIMVDLACMATAKNSHQAAFMACVKQLEETAFDGKESWLKLCGMFEGVDAIPLPAVDAASCYEPEEGPDAVRLCTALQCRYERFLADTNEKVERRVGALSAGLQASLPGFIRDLGDLADRVDEPNNGGAPPPEAFAALMSQGMRRMRNAAMGVDPSVEGDADPNFINEYAAAASVALHSIFTEDDAGAGAGAGAAAGAAANNLDDLSECQQQ